MAPHDDTPRLVKIGDALTQLFNVALLPNHTDTDANESTSGRAHRKGWRTERLIDILFLWLGGGADHCRESVAKDVERARRTLARSGDVS
jgi:hypothetical protein